MGRLEPSKDNSVVGRDATIAEGEVVYVTAIYIVGVTSQSDLGSGS